MTEIFMYFQEKEHCSKLQSLHQNKLENMRIVGYRVYYSNFENISDIVRLPEKSF